jgi:predicted HAD superfamily Cof-like phosphohydrolase
MVQLHDIVDGLADVIFVAVGSLHKLGFDAQTIEKFMHAVCDSNFTKFPMVKNAGGKVTKWPNYTKPNIAEIIEML